MNLSIDHRPLSTAKAYFCTGCRLSPNPNIAPRKTDLSKAPMISIIDDDPSVRVATDGLVRSLGYRAATFASAEDYLQSDRTNDTFCVITDAQMPGLSGVELQSLLI